MCYSDGMVAPHSIFLPFLPSVGAEGLILLELNCLVPLPQSGKQPAAPDKSYENQLELSQAASSRADSTGAASYLPGLERGAGQPGSGRTGFSACPVLMAAYLTQSSWSQAGCPLLSPAVSQIYLLDPASTRSQGPDPDCIPFSKIPTIHFLSQVYQDGVELHLNKNFVP